MKIISTKQELFELTGVKSLDLISDIDKIEIIRKTIANYFEIPVENLEIKSRKRKIVLPRQICHYFVKETTDLFLIKIGKMIGNKDHATVLYSIKTINNLIERNKEIAGQVNEIKFLINKQLNI